MGWIDRLLGREQAIQVIDPESNDQVGVYIKEAKGSDSPVGNKSDDFPDIHVGNFIDYSAFSKFRSLADNRTKQYRAYEEMTTDIIISSALEMYADDASQYDTDGEMIWVESDNEELKDWLNELIETLDIKSNLWKIYYSLALYGDVYIRLFKVPKGQVTAEESMTSSGLLTESSGLNEDLLNPTHDYLNFVEIVDNPEDVYDLIKNGKTAQFAVVNRDSSRKTSGKEERVELYPSDQFVHILLQRPNVRDRHEFEFFTRDPEDGKQVRHTYKIKSGKSMLHDIYAVEKEIQLLENSLLLNRLSKSAITRLLGVEVADMSKPEVGKLLRRVKSSLESKLAISSGEGIKSYSDPGQLDNIIVHPIRNGKGSISSQTIGGDVDVKSLLDLDYFNDKRFGGLKIPKAFLGFEEALGSNSGGTLTKMDARYGRTIKRLQSCVISGISDLLNMYLIAGGRSEEVNNFTVRLVSPTTVEDLDREDLLSTRLNLVSNILNIFGDVEGVDRKVLLGHICDRYLNDAQLKDIILNNDDGLGGPKPPGSELDGDSKKDYQDKIRQLRQQIGL